MNLRNMLPFEVYWGFLFEGFKVRFRFLFQGRATMNLGDMLLLNVCCGCQHFASQFGPVAEPYIQLRVSKIVVVVVAQPFFQHTTKG